MDRRQPTDAEMTWERKREECRRGGRGGPEKGLGAGPFRRCKVVWGPAIRRCMLKHERQEGSEKLA